MILKNLEFKGTYRRLIDLKTWDSNTVVAWLEDDYHHFGVTVNHDGGVITAVRVVEHRFPWSACPRAVEPLQDLVGTPLFGRCSDIGQVIDMRKQCTHLFDLTGLLIAHAYHQRDHHRYHAVVSVLDESAAAAGSCWVRAVLNRDEQPVLSWDLAENTIMRPESCAGRTIDRGFREWTETMDELDAEFASVLRRATFVSYGRRIMQTVPHYAVEMNVPTVCYTYQPENRNDSIRVLENNRRFDQGPEEMLQLVHTKP